MEQEGLRWLIVWNAYILMFALKLQQRTLIIATIILSQETRLKWSDAGIASTTMKDSALVIMLTMISCMTISAPTESGKKVTGMDEYISKESAISIFRAKEEMAVCTTAQPYFARAAKMMELLPAADVAPVRHGRWKPYHEADIGYDEYGVRCSNCKFEVEDHEVNFIMKYCPNCGAKMDLKDV